LQFSPCTFAPTEGPTDNDKLDEELLYEAEGGLMKPGTSAAAGITAGTTVASTLVSSDSSDADRHHDSGGEGVREGEDGEEYAYKGKAGGIYAVIQVTQQAKEVEGA
jgi:hypothetical protein